MNHRGFELAISTILLLILGILTIVAIIYALVGGFSKLETTSGSLLSSAEGTALKKACEIACSTEDYLTFCCKEFKIDKFSLYCKDEQLIHNCPLSCKDYTCPSQS